LFGQKPWPAESNGWLEHSDLKAAFLNPGRHQFRGAAFARRHVARAVRANQKYVLD
jgi:hypothetical protein